jgi:hypothetical protein
MAASRSEDDGGFEGALPTKGGLMGNMGCQHSYNKDKALIVTNQRTKNNAASIAVTMDGG